MTLSEQRKLQREALQSVAGAYIQARHPQRQGTLRVKVEFRKDFHWRVTRTNYGARITLWIDPSRLFQRDFSDMLEEAILRSIPLVTGFSHAKHVDQGEPSE